MEQKTGWLLEWKCFYNMLRFVIVFCNLKDSYKTRKQRGYYNYKKYLNQESSFSELGSHWKSANS